MNKARILVVDDQIEILRSLEGILSDEGHDIILAKDGQEALHAVQTESPDVVFLDVWIPGIDGLQTLKAIKRIDPNCSVIMMSGHGTIETAVKAIKLGASDYLEKPLNLEDVLHLVQKAISARAPAADPKKAKWMMPPEFIGVSDKAAQVRRAVETAAGESSSVWLTGAKGTGKEFVARIIHHLQGKNRNSLVKVLCTDLDADNFEETFFGKTNGPQPSKAGKIAQAQGGTLLLHRVDRVKEPLRDALARVVAGLTSAGAKGSPRIIATSVLEPEDLADEGRLSRELVRTLSQRIIRLPSLSERMEDLPQFVEHFVREASTEFDKEIHGADTQAMERLRGYQWPGNVKELKILIEHVVMTAPGPTITSNDLLIPVERAPRDECGSEAVARGASIREVTPAALVRPDSGFREDSAASKRYQKTLRGNVVMYGQGLHSGTKTGLTLSPMPAGSGILFGHITSGGTVPALVEFVESTGYSTCLRGIDASARTVEHLMAVFHVYGLTNLLVKISGEVPIMDGSAVEFCRLVESAEIIVQEDPIDEIRIRETIALPLSHDSGKSMSIEPFDAFEVEYRLNYPAPVGEMELTYRVSEPSDFRDVIAPARTFGFVKDMRMMNEMGLANGGRLSNVVLLDDEKVVNPPLRFPDEFVRHKILDIIGDFYLLGRPIRGKVIASQTGHTENIAMLKLIRETL
ncbi:MAG: UDP-3-O-acyl-N-acetylglucosamine deacetylase [Thermodesulfobacteriota bacterium]